MAFWFFTIFAIGIAGSEPGPYFWVESYNSVTYESELSVEAFEEDIRTQNQILSRAQSGIEWTRGIDTDSSKFDGINFEPAAEIYSIKWTNSFFTGVSQGVNKRSAYHDFELEITLNKLPDGTDRDFQADLEVVYATEWTLKQGMKDDIIVSENIIFQWIYNGRTDVKTYTTENGEKVETGECFRTDASPGSCDCEWRSNYVQDWEGKCIKADKSVISCENGADIGGSRFSREDGLLECPEGYEIRVPRLQVKLTRSNEETCSEAKKDEKKSLKMYKTCDEEQTVWDYVQNKCNGKQTCEYKFYEGETPSNKKYKTYCKGLSRYVIVPYGCSKLAGPEPKPTNSPEDICGSCAETGFTKETDCDYTGVEVESTTQRIPIIDADEVDSYDDCLQLCNSNSHCKAFTYFHRTGTVNCYIKSAILNKECNNGNNFTFSRKCDLSKECSSDNEHCAVSRIPFFVYGPTKWKCTDSDNIKRCSLFCEDGFSQEVDAKCGDKNVWKLESSADALGMYNPGCQTCSGNPNVTFPISDGGRWECNVDHHNRKVCLPYCDTPKEIKGSLQCLRDNHSWDMANADPNGYTPDRKLSKSDELSCFWPTCTVTEFPELLQNFLSTKKWEISVTESDFKLSAKEDSMKAFLNCPENGGKSKTKCICKIKKGKRKFKCSNLTKIKGC